MAIPDLTPQMAVELRQQHQTPRNIVIIFLVAFGYLAAVGWLARYLQARYVVPVLATGSLAIGFAYVTLALLKPSLYWNSAAVINARLGNSASTITIGSIGFGLAFIALGILGIMW
jgi:hypothetical protein